MKKVLLIAAILLLSFSGEFFAGSLYPNTSLFKDNHQPLQPTLNWRLEDKALTRSGGWWDKLWSYDAGELRFYPALNYVYSKGYPVGINIAGMRLGLTPDDVRFDISESEYRVPTFSLHGMYYFASNVIGPVGFGFGADFGLNWAKRYFPDPYDPNNWYSKKKVYLSLAPVASVHVWILNAFVGYEFVFGFKQIQGLIYGGGLSFCLHYQ